MGDIPEPIEGQVPEGQYHINRTSFDLKAIEHGWIILQTIDNNEFTVAASFLCFKSLNEAEDVHRNLLQLKGERFLRSHFIIERKEGIWVAVEKIGSSLEDYKNLHRLSLDNPEARLPPNYQLIIRDIIMGLCQIHQQELIHHGNFSSKHIMIIKDRAKFGFITNPDLCSKKKNKKTNPDSESRDSNFTKLREIFVDVLGQIPNHVELIHFHESAKSTHWRNLRKLYFHPLLMSSGERFLLPVRADARLHYRKDRIQDMISKFKILFANCNWISVVLERRDGYLAVLHRRPNGIEYEDDAWGLFKFVRNAIIHFNENIRNEWLEINRQISQLNYRGNEVQNLRKRRSFLKMKTEAEVEEDLSSMFPYFLIKVYDLLLLLDEIVPPVWKPFLED